jgi:hypothetical protein
MLTITDVETNVQQNTPAPGLKLNQPGKIEIGLTGAMFQSTAA